MTGICGWFLAFLFFLGAECTCRCLVSLWFAFGAAAAFVLAALGRQIEEQLLMFVLGSLAAFLLIRPLAFLGNFLKNLKTGDFPAKTKKKVGGHGAEAGYK